MASFTYSARVDQVICRLQSVRNADHDLRFLLLKIKLRLLCRSSCCCRFIPHLLFRFPPPLRLLGCLLLPPPLHRSHVLLAFHLPFPSLDLCFALLQSDTGLALPFSDVCICLCRSKVGVSVRAFLAGARGPVVAEEVIVIGKTARGPLSACGGCTTAEAGTSGDRCRLRHCVSINRISDVRRTFLTPGPAPPYCRYRLATCCIRSSS